MVVKHEGPAIVSSPADIGEYHIADGSPLPGTTGGYAERYIHSEILQRYPDVQAVVHSHCEDVLPYTVLDYAGNGDQDGKGMRGMRPVYHMAGFLGGEVPNFDIEGVYEEGEPRDMLVNSVRLGGALAGMFGRNETRGTEPLHTMVLMRGHGFVTVGDSVEQVTDFAYYASSNARVLTKALLLAGCQGGDVRHLIAEERKATNEMNRWIVFKPWRQWVMEVERSGRFVNELGTPPLEVD